MVYGLITHILQISSQHMINSKYNIQVIQWDRYTNQCTRTFICFLALQMVIVVRVAQGLKQRRKQDNWIPLLDVGDQPELWLTP
jgi:hypothetical protein